MANFKVGDICVIKPEGIWHSSRGKTLKITELIDDDFCYFQFIDNKATYGIFLRELELASKLHKVLM